MPTFTLRVTGNASTSKTAEQANLRIASSSDGANKPTVCDEVLTTAGYIADMIRKVQENDNPTSSISYWTQTSLSTSDWIEHMPLHLARGQDIVGNIPDETPSSSVFDNDPLGLNGRSAQVVPVRRYRARVEFDVHFHDFAILSEFTSHLSTLEHCQIGWLNWVLPSASEERCRSQLRIKAAKDARSKVVDYCQILCPGQDGIMIVPTELGDGKFASLTSGNDKAMHGLFSVAQGSGAAASAGKKEAQISFTPREIEMSLSIDLVFTVETNGFKLGTMLSQDDRTSHVNE